MINNGRNKMSNVTLNELDALEIRREKYNKWAEMRSYMGISRDASFVFVQFRCSPDTFYVHVKTGNAIIVETGEHIHMSSMHDNDCYHYIENKYGLDMNRVIDALSKVDYL